MGIEGITREREREKEMLVIQRERAQEQQGAGGVVGFGQEMSRLTKVMTWMWI